MITLTRMEFDCLIGEPHVAWATYLHLRRLMDRRTGLVEGVTWAGLAQLIAVSHEPGLQGAGTPSKSAVRRVCARLARLGLLRSESDDRRLILRLLLAPGPLRLVCVDGVEVLPRDAS